MVRGNYQTRQVFIDELELLPDESQKIINHSPDGFNWGYGGSGPAQLSLALMLHFTGDSRKAFLLHHPFKWDVISGLPQGDFELDENFITNWIKNKKAED